MTQKSPLPDLIIDPTVRLSESPLCRYSLVDFSGRRFVLRGTHHDAQRRSGATCAAAAGGCRASGGGGAARTAAVPPRRRARRRYRRRPRARRRDKRRARRRYSRGGRTCTRRDPAADGEREAAAGERRCGCRRRPRRDLLRVRQPGRRGPAPRPRAHPPRRRRRRRGRVRRQRVFPLRRRGRRAHVRGGWHADGVRGPAEQPPAAARQARARALLALAPGPALGGAGGARGGPPPRRYRRTPAGEWLRFLVAALRCAYTPLLRLV